MKEEYSGEGSEISSSERGLTRNTLELQTAMLDATPDCIKVMTPEGTLIAMSKSGCHALGVRQAEVNGTPWIPLLPASLHVAAGEALTLAATGVPARFAGHSEASGNVVFWDNLLTPVLDSSGTVDSIICVSRDVTEKTLLEKQLENSLAREQLLACEMQHRIKNVFTVVNGLMMIAEREAAASGSPGRVGQIMTAKLGALSRASDAILKNSDQERLDVEVLVDSVLQPFGTQCRMVGSKQFIKAELSNTLALALHELATNSVKHGALSSSEGEVEIVWEIREARLEILWRETGGPRIPNPPTKQGFGTKLIDRIVASAGGAVVKSWFVAGLEVELSLPLKND